MARKPKITPEHIKGSIALRQIKELVDNGMAITIDIFGGYQTTVYDRLNTGDNNHHHYMAPTLEEAIMLAYVAFKKKQ